MYQMAKLYPEPPYITSSKKCPFCAFSVADELIKFKWLLDEGVITKEEFEKKKAELLA